MPDIFERFRDANLAERETLLAEYRKALKSQIASNPGNVLAALKQDYDPAWSFAHQQQLYKLFKSAKQALNNTPPSGLKPLKIAAVGSTTLTQLLWLLELNLLASGWLAEVYEADYGVFRQEVLDASSGLYAFKPDVLFILTGHRDLLIQPDIGWSASDIELNVEREFNNWLRLWETYYRNTGHIIIQNNFDLPDIRIFGNLETRITGSQSSFLQRLNLLMVNNLPEYVLLHDLDYLSAYHGKKHFNDPRFYHYSKQQCSFEILPAYAASLAAIVRAQYGMIHKCLVLDLDNTLWGGVIGDDGLEEIVIGEGTPEGEAYLALQQFAKSLKERGILLAVCSKNTDEIAKEPFISHPDMALKLSDIACFVANWEPKPDNIRSIAQQLNIGLDSLVFVDDNPAERAIVRQLIPEVSVPELPDDPSLYIRTLTEGNYFEPIALSEEDRMRTRFYIDNSKRDALAQTATSIDDFLSRLQMVATIRPFDEIDLDRITQLVARSNQFNLTTHRYTRAELQTMMNDPQYVTRSVRLADTFGDNGLISVLIGKHKGNELEIDTWLMSCRVLSRGVEQHVRNNLVQFAQVSGIKAMTGAYIPTKKNRLVEHHYEKLGFICKDARDDGTTKWQLLIDKNTLLLPTHIKDV